MCFHNGALVLCYALVMLRLYFSQFFASFFIGLRRIYSRTDVRNLITDICSLLAADLILWVIN